MSEEEEKKKILERIREKSFQQQVIENERKQ